MDTNLLNAIAAVASAAAAFASVVVAVRISRRAESMAIAERERTAAFAAGEAARADAFAASERRHASFNTVAEWRRDLRDWAAGAIDVLSEATYLCDEIADDNTDLAERSLPCRHRLSSVIDRGRFFLPNIRKDEYGVDKPFAYRGYRHSALDPLVAAERVLSTGYLGAFTDRKHALVAMKREFVSSIQKILDPERHNHEVARMIKEGHQAAGDDRNLGGLLADSHTLPIGAEGMLQNPPSSHLGLRNRGEKNPALPARTPEETAR
ncbi:MAG TPA: hypothetical protein VF006_10680 [Longimicrobium sp.]